MLERSVFLCEFLMEMNKFKVFKVANRSSVQPEFGFIVLGVNIIEQHY